jgi:hypothetical protein
MPAWTGSKSRANLSGAAWSCGNSPGAGGPSTRCGDAFRLSQGVPSKLREAQMEELRTRWCWKVRTPRAGALCSPSAASSIAASVKFEARASAAEMSSFARDTSRLAASSNRRRNSQRVAHAALDLPVPVSAPTVNLTTSDDDWHRADFPRCVPGSYRALPPPFWDSRAVLSAQSITLSSQRLPCAHNPSGIADVLRKYSSVR